jgi:hypothetical protein
MVWKSRSHRATCALGAAVPGVSRAGRAERQRRAGYRSASGAAGTALRDQIIALFEELALPFVDRDDVQRKVLDIAARGDVC